ncbi:serine hydrolase domain-containing protein [Microbulbifer guangxiensis]|uniref:serine hydrolase domain-containing protein n=1 Tax=Microbulbifer guangxiensis TaxID=2904249 RepID=UPI001F3E5026|nr:serine hydrolase domain-containing protein [Microbulbifer guangxiensis]
MLRLLGLTVTLAGLLLTAAFTFAADTGNKPSTLTELKSAIRDVMERHQVPAVGVAMVDESGPVWVGSLGKANIAEGTAADADTMYRIGSTSKMFVSLSVLKLVEEGRLSLDDKLSDLAPEIAYENPWEDTHPIRIVHLLEHTTGWDDIHLPQFAQNEPAYSLKQGLDFHPHSRKSRWKPGTRMAYCNAGPPVAAYIVQKVTGQDFEEYVAEQFFRPLGMETVTYRLTDDVMQHGATLYVKNEPQSYWHISLRSSGAINVSPADMSRFVTFFVNRGRVDGQALLSPESLARMERSTSTNGARAGLELGYGLSNYSSVYEHWVYRAHRGAVRGGRSVLAYLPEAKTGHAIMINADNTAALREISRLVRAYETRNLTPPPLKQKTALAVDAGEIEGFYMPINPRQQTPYFAWRILGIESVSVDEGRIASKPLLGGDPEYYYPVSEGLFRPGDINQAGLAIASDPLAGKVLQVESRTYQPVSAASVFGLLGTGGAWIGYMASSLLFFPIWGIRRLRQAIPAGLPTQVRMWPLLSSLCIITTVALLAVAINTDPIVILARPSSIAVAIMAATVLFAVFSVTGLYTVYRARNVAMNRVAYWHSTLGAVLHGSVMVYLLYYGVIGLRTWA